MTKCVTAGTIPAEINLTKSMTKSQAKKQAKFKGETCGAEGAASGVGGRGFEPRQWGCPGP